LLGFDGIGQKDLGLIMLVPDYKKIDCEYSARKDVFVSFIEKDLSCDQEAVDLVNFLTHKDNEQKFAEAIKKHMVANYR